MRKLAGLALIGALAMAAVSTGAEAARVLPPGPSGSNGNGPIACIAACPPPPPPRADCLSQGPVAGGPPAAGGLLVVPRHPCKPASGVAACGRKLGNLRRVTVSQVLRIGGGDKVRLVPICDTVHRTLTETEMNYLARGNVQGLIRPISRNETLVAALDDGGYRADDVLGIVLDPHMVTLYVSRARAGR